MQTRCIANITEINADDWNALVSEHSPFVRYEFLLALEKSGCVTPKSGWLPQHVIVTDNDRLIGALPFYIKGHSYGEYVFDWAWADAYHRHGYEYYPKGLCAIPFTPASCAKFLVHPDFYIQEIAPLLVSQCLKIAQELNLSSVHSLFLNSREQKFWHDTGFINRTGYQFHWENKGYKDFGDYLSQFSSAKRKKIRQERKSIHQSNIEFKIRTGDQISRQLWQDFHRFYCNTITTHGGMVYLNLDFFMDIGMNMGRNIVLIQAYKDQENIASALFFQGRDTLYGRYWGCDKSVKNLHFELCYYQAIDYCIAHQLGRFEAGAQGEHKLSRGLLPVTTLSSHWLKHPEFSRVIDHHVKNEIDQVETYIDYLNKHSPFKAA